MTGSNQLSETIRSHLSEAKHHHGKIACLLVTGYVFVTHDSQPMHPVLAAFVSGSFAMAILGIWNEWGSSETKELDELLEVEQ